MATKRDVLWDDCVKVIRFGVSVSLVFVKVSGQTEVYMDRMKFYFVGIVTYICNGGKTVFQGHHLIWHISFWKGSAEGKAHRCCSKQTTCKSNVFSLKRGKDNN